MGKAYKLKVVFFFEKHRNIHNKYNSNFFWFVFPQTKKEEEESVADPHNKPAEEPECYRSNEDRTKLL